MQAKDLLLGEYYEIKNNPGVWRFEGSTPQKRHGYTIHVLAFKEIGGGRLTKETAHGVKPSILPVTTIGNKKVVTLPKTPEYDKLSGYVELVATFLRTIGIEGGVIDIEHNGEIVPTVFVFPSYVNRLQELIKKVNMINLETTK